MDGVKVYGWIRFWFAWCGLAGSVTARADDARPLINKVVVSIECTSKDGKISRGTGVLVSRDGRVLTAKHVAPRSYTCLGEVGTAAKKPTRSLVHNPHEVNVDAILLRFVKEVGEEFPFARYRKLEDNLKGKTITAHGFPRGRLGEIVVTQGVIGELNPDSRGIIGTDALQSTGMSGGPVLLKRDGSLLGIIVGADFDVQTGSPQSFGVLAAQEVAHLFELSPAGALGVSSFRSTPVKEIYRLSANAQHRAIVTANAAEGHEIVEYRFVKESEKGLTGTEPRLAADKRSVTYTFMLSAGHSEDLRWVLGRIETEER